MKARLAVVAALLVTLFVGRLWGASGRWELNRLLQAAALRGSLLEAHAALLGAQASLCNADFVDTSRRLEDARGFVERAGTRLGKTGLNDELLRRQLTGFGAGIDEAQQLAAWLSRGADHVPGVHGPALPSKISEKP
jgi:hypothetical protein